MSFWKWDSFQDIISQSDIELEADEILPTEISKVTFERLEDYQLHMHVESPPNEIDTRKNLRLGEFYKNDKQLTFSSPISKGIISGVIHINSITNFPSSGNATTINTYVISAIEINISSKKENSYIVENIANLPKQYIWPHISTYEETSIAKRTFRGEPSMIFSLDEKKTQVRRSSLRINLETTSLVLEEINSLPNKVQNPGYIIYQNSAEEKFREIVRDCISYAFGIPLIYFGHSEYNSNGKLVRLRAVSPHTVNGRAWKIKSTPPAPITEQEGVTNMLSAELIQEIVLGLLKNRDKYTLSTLTWRLWYAEAAPYFMRPAYYGALIEGLQKSYIAENTVISGSIVDKSKYLKVRKTLLRYLRKIKLDVNDEKLISDKINNGNSAPQKLLSKRFYESLGLTIGDLESRAWNKRNDAAHGNNIPEEDILQFIRETYILRIMLNRIFLKITKGSNQYIDSYSYGHAIRLIAESIETQDVLEP